MRPSEGTEEIQSVVLLFSLTCLTEQKERDQEGGGGEKYILWWDSPSACVSVCVCVWVGVSMQRLRILGVLNMPDIYYSGGVMD